MHDPNSITIQLNLNELEATYDVLTWLNDPQLNPIAKKLDLALGNWLHGASETREISEVEALGGFLEDSTQRLKESPYDPGEEVRAEHEDFLTKLEALAVFAIATNDWNEFYKHLIDFQSQHDLHGVTGVAIGEGENL